MRTRRNPRNQERLWKALGGAPEPKPVAAKPLTADEVRAMWWLPKTSRNLMLRDIAKRENVPAGIEATE